jgi:hypothetical protein
MSTTTSLNVTPAEPWAKEQLRLIDLRVRAYVARDTPDGIDFDDWDTTYTVDPGGLSLQFETRWAPDFGHVAIAMSNAYPEAEVRLDVRWDTRDTDEAGAYAWIYRAGKATDRGNSDVVLNPVDAEGFPLAISGRLDRLPGFKDLPAPERGARRGRETLIAHSGWPGHSDDLEAGIADVISDMLHFADTLNLDADSILARALHIRADEIHHPN